MRRYTEPLVYLLTSHDARSSYLPFTLVRFEVARSRVTEG